MVVPLRVLVVEDSEEDAELLLIELRRGGYQPIFRRVETPEAMREALEEQVWDIITSDYVMPRFSGPAALELVQRMQVNLPFIMVTGQVSEEIAVEALEAGAHDYVMKNNLSRLVPVIQRELKYAQMRWQAEEG